MAVNRTPWGLAAGIAFDSPSPSRNHPTMIEGPEDSLGQAYSTWSAVPWWRHAAAIGLLTGIIVLRWWKWFGAEYVLSDELPYAWAFDAVSRGESPFTISSYLYPSFFAIVGSWAQAVLGQHTVLRLLRVANALGVATTVWIAMAWLPWRWRRRILAGTAFVSLAPTVAWGMELGNLSLAVSGMALAALVLYHRWTVLSGLSLGLAMAIKPIAPMAAVILAAHRPLPTQTHLQELDRRRLVAAGLAAAVAAGLVLAFPYLDEFIAIAGVGRGERTVTLHRLPYMYGFRIHSLWISAPLALIGLWIARRFPLGPGRLVCLAVAASLAVTPVVWSHTLIFALPLQVIAVQIACLSLAARRGSGSLGAASDEAPSLEPGVPADSASTTTSPSTALYELIFVLLGVAAIQFAAGAHNIYDQSTWLQLVGAGLPTIAPACLTAYIFARAESF